VALTRTPRPQVRARRRPRAAVRWGAGFAVGGVVCAVSYAVLRLVSLARGEPSFSEVVMAGTTAFYWRCALAALQGAVAGLLAWAGLGDDHAEQVLRWAPIWIPLVVLPLALAMVGFP
jgi:hypothetical protein